MAKRMLVDTEMPVINIAYELSYNETNYFSKAFKKKVGVTPSEYRTAHPSCSGSRGGLIPAAQTPCSAGKGGETWRNSASAPESFFGEGALERCAGCRTKKL